MMSLVLSSWIVFKSLGLLDKFELDSILGKEDQLFKSIGKFRYLGMEEFFLIESCSINVDFIENKTGEITAGTYLISIAQIKNSALQTRTGAQLTVNNFISGLIWGNDSTIYLLDSPSKDENDNL